MSLLVKALSSASSPHHTLAKQTVPVESLFRLQNWALTFRRSLRRRLTSCMQRYGSVGDAEAAKPWTWPRRTARASVVLLCQQVPFPGIRLSLLALACAKTLTSARAFFNRIVPGGCGCPGGGSLGLDCRRLHPAHRSAAGFFSRESGELLARRCAVSLRCLSSRP